MHLSTADKKRNAERTAALLHKKSRKYRTETTKRVRNKISVLSKAAASKANSKAIKVQRAIRELEKNMSDKTAAQMKQSGPHSPEGSPPQMNIPEPHSPEESPLQLNIAEPQSPEGSPPLTYDDDESEKQSQSNESNARSHSRKHKSKKHRHEGKRRTKRRH